MDDFLHNLRSGKLKQPDRSNRNYGDPQYKGKRNVADRRKREYEAKESFERLNAIKEILESVAETQKRMATSYENRTKAEERKAKALEVLAQSVYRMANPKATDTENLFAQPESIPAIEAHEEIVETGDLITENASTAEPINEAQADQNKLGAGSRKQLYKLIQKMRDKGVSWEQISRRITAQGFPTVSGRGNWRGGMVKNLYEKMNAG